MIDTDNDLGFGYGLKSGGTSDNVLIGPGSNNYGRTSGFFSRKDAGGFPDTFLKEQFRKATENIKKSDTDIPRKVRMDMWGPAELAIHNAIQEVEKMPADTLLTEAVILLSQAQDKVAEYIDKTQTI